jgi:hypothetical protein
LTFGKFIQTLPYDIFWLRFPQLPFTKGTHFI